VHPIPLKQIFRLLLPLLLASPIVSAGQPVGFSEVYENWRWAHFRIDSGLPSDRVEFVCETSDSVLWAGTDKGIARYDGYRWIPMNGKGQFPSERPMVMHACGAGLVVGFMGGRSYIGGRDGVEQLPPDIRDILPLPGDTCLLLCRDSLIQLFNIHTRQVSPFHIGSVDRIAPNHGLWRTRSGLVLANIYEGLYSSNGNGPWELRMKGTTEALWVNSLCSDRDGNGFISLAKPVELRGLWAFTPAGKFSRNVSEKGDRIVSMDCSADGSVALALYSSGEVLLGGKEAWKTLTPLPVPLEHALVLRFRMDGNLVVGGTQGVWLFRRLSARWTYSTLPPPFKNRVHEIIRTTNGDLWLGTADGVEIHSPDGTVRTITSINGRPLNDVTGLCQSGDGSIWVSSGSSFQGAYHFDGVRWSYEPIDAGLPTMKIHRIVRSPDGTLWFLRLSGSSDDGSPGVYLYKGHRFEGIGVGDGLPSNSVYSVTFTKDGGVALGTSAGLGIRSADGKWRYYFTGAEQTVEVIFSVSADSAGNLWFCNRYGGLNELLPGGRIVNHAPFLADQSMRNFWSIVCDHSGTIWVTSETGCASYRDGRWKAFTEASGIRTAQLWPVLPSDSVLWIGTIGYGLARLDLSTCRDSLPLVLLDPAITENGTTLLRWYPYSYGGILQPEEIMTRYRLDTGSWSSWSVVHSARLTDLPSGGHAVFVQARNVFGEFQDDHPPGMEFSVLPPIYLRPGVLIPVGLLSAALVVLSAVFALQRRRDLRRLRMSEARFRRLTESTFEGILLHRNGVIIDCNENLAALLARDAGSLRGKPVKELLVPESIPGLDAWLQSETMHPVEAIGLRSDGKEISLELYGKILPTEGPRDLALRVIAVRDITPRKQVEQQLLQYQEQLRRLALQLTAAEERERREIAGYLHDYVSQELAFCRIKLDALREPVKRKDIDEVASHVNTLFEQMQSLTFQLSPPILAELGLVDAIESLADLFFEKHGLEVQISDAAGDLSIGPGMRTFLFNTVRELLSNIVKHARAVHASVTLTSSAEGLCIRVDDDGAGFSPGEPGQTVHGGFGLFNIRERLRVLGGSLTIASGRGAGSTVTILIPPEAISSSEGEQSV
jgi:PAS domain S-box-containing protein